MVRHDPLELNRPGDVVSLRCLSVHNFKGFSRVVEVVLAQLVIHYKY
jgi:hypothetical protein